MSQVQDQEWTISASRLLALEKYSEAADLLQQIVASKPTGEAHALLAVAYFQLEKYDAAAEQYEKALAFDPSNQGWREMRDLARTNAMAGVEVRVPALTFFERDRLLAPATLPPGTLPAPLPPSRPGFVTRLRRFLGNRLGDVGTIGMTVVTELVGRICGYRGKVWTDWYRRPFTIALLTLAYMREKLDRDNLKDAYPRGALVGFHPKGTTPPEGVTHFRTADGTWNNLSDPKEGAAGTRFHRNVENAVIRAETGESLLSPNPREISRKLLSRENGMKEIPFLNMLAASWINFENHDWVHHGEDLIDDYIEVPLADDDPARQKFQQTNIRIGRTQPDPTRMEGREETPATFINEVTHWWDASQVYGSNQETVDRLRTGVDGKLKVRPDGTLPLDDKGIELTGFTRNWWVGLSMLHTLFTREHNAICDRLKGAHPDWDDDRLFNVARLINAAVTAKIHSVEWTPAILPNRGLEAGLNANWYGILTNQFRRGKKKKTVATINIRNPELGGVVGNPINKHGQPYGLTEEFVEVYRLHSLLPEFINVKRVDRPDRPAEAVPFVATRQAGSAKLTGRVSMSDLFFSFGNQHPGQLVLNNFPRFMQELSIPGNRLFDLAAVDIVRARERGVPRYNEFRRQLGLNPIRSFDDLTDDAGQVREMKAVYGGRPEDIEKLDLMVGTLAEGYRPTGFGFGETLFQIFILNASRRLQADRFYTDSYNEDVYTKEGMQWIDDASLKTVLLRHYPELAGTGLANVKNAFEPWDTEKALKPERHPLRAFDRELRPDPWLGDAWR